ncbi:hypothetical protein SynROS8604_02610 [Synechococcus sp. ROS8604]|nr:hypothetical protein SynROS8604_02610 [Synechococcus sp. ROS8604]
MKIALVSLTISTRESALFLSDGDKRKFFFLIHMSHSFKL